MDALRIFIGYDPKEAVAFHVCANSLIRHSSRPLAIVPLALNLLAKEYDERHTDGSNQFIYSRFLVPYLCNFNGPALYLDGDMVVKADIAELFALNQLDKDVMVVKHDYQTKYPVKYFGQSNTDYPRKNWTSVMLFNCSNYPNRCLLPGYVEKQTGEHLHRLQWIADGRIGELPMEWNWLVGEYEMRNDAKLYHYTLGIPACQGYDSCDSSQEWWDELHFATDVAG